MAVFKKTLWRRIGLGIGVCLLVLLGLAQFFKRDLLRLQFVLTLFAPSTIAENFRSMNRIIESRTVRPSGPTYRLPFAGRPLPETYTYHGHRLPLREWVTRTATSGLIVVQDGAIVFERYYLGNGPRTPWAAWSASDPVLAALVGIAQEEGWIRSVSDLVTDYVPQLERSGYAGVSLKDVLQKASGIAFDAALSDFTSDINGVMRAMALGGSMDAHIVRLERRRHPGAVHRPVGMDAQVLAMVIEGATGRSLPAYMEERLWSRLGAEAAAYWLVDDHGRALAVYGLNAILRDYARFGLLTLNGGRNFRGQQILPAHWVRASITDDNPRPGPGSGSGASPSLGYGYQWRLAPLEGDYWSVGLCGQFIYVHPRHGVVIVKASADLDHLRAGNEVELESLAVFRAVAAHVGRAP